MLAPDKNRKRQTEAYDRLAQTNVIPFFQERSREDWNRLIEFTNPKKDWKAALKAFYVNKFPGSYKMRKNVLAQAFHYHFEVISEPPSKKSRVGSPETESKVETKEGEKPETPKTAETPKVETKVEPRQVKRAKKEKKLELSKELQEYMEDQKIRENQKQLFKGFIKESCKPLWFEEINEPRCQLTKGLKELVKLRGESYFPISKNDSLNVWFRRLYCYNVTVTQEFLKAQIDRYYVGDEGKLISKPGADISYEEDKTYDLQSISVLPHEAFLRTLTFVPGPISRDLIHQIELDEGKMDFWIFLTFRFDIVKPGDLLGELKLHIKMEEAVTLGFVPKSTADAIQNFSTVPASNLPVPFEKQTNHPLLQFFKSHLKAHQENEIRREQNAIKWQKLDASF